MRKGLNMTAAQVAAHNARHGSLRCGRCGVDHEFGKCLVDKNATTMAKVSVPKSRMNKTETAYSLILEAMKRRGDIQEWRFEGLSLAWGADPATGKPMHYKPDFVVFLDSWQRVRLIEVKGPHIFDRDLVRFKGCRAAWPMFAFEMHQKKGGEWQRIH